MKQGEMAKWLKVLVVFTGVAGGAFMAFMVPNLMEVLAAGTPGLGWLARFGSLFIWLTAIPAYLALWKVWLICTEISRNNSFSKRNAVLLGDISKLCLADSLLYLLVVLLLLAAGHLDVFLLLLIFAAVFLGVFLAVITAALSHLTEKASALKRENDLTI